MLEEELEWSGISLCWHLFGPYWVKETEGHFNRRTEALSILSSVNSHVNFWLQNVSVKWDKSVNGSGNAGYGSKG